MIERWESVLGYKGLYEVSSLGRVKSIKRSGTPGIIKKQVIGYHTGVPYVSVSKNSKVERLSVPRIVLEAFKGKCPKGMECCHNNGDSTDNRISNLRWDTHKNNLKDKIRHGTHGKVLNPSKVKLIRILRKDFGWRLEKLAEFFGIHRSTVKCVVYRQTWDHVA